MKNTLLIILLLNSVFTFSAYADEIKGSYTCNVKMRNTINEELKNNFDYKIVLNLVNNKNAELHTTDRGGSNYVTTADYKINENLVVFSNIYAVTADHHLEENISFNLSKNKMHISLGHENKKYVNREKDKALVLGTCIKKQYDTKEITNSFIGIWKGDTKFTYMQIKRKDKSLQFIEYSAHTSGKKVSKKKMLFNLESYNSSTMEANIKGDILQIVPISEGINITAKIQENGHTLLLKVLENNKIEELNYTKADYKTASKYINKYLEK